MGREGVKKSGNFADVIYGSPQRNPLCAASAHHCAKMPAWRVLHRQHDWVGNITPARPAGKVMLGKFVKETMQSKLIQRISDIMTIGL